MVPQVSLQHCMTVNGPIFLAKEDNVTSEQTFLVAVQVINAVPSGQTMIEPATVNADYTIDGRSTSILSFIFPPDQKRINFPFILYPDQLPEEREAFQATASPEHSLRTGETYPDFFSPTKLSASTFVIIEDNDRKLILD